MKIYGNASSDGFVPFLVGITVLFVAAGVGLAKVGAMVLLAGLPLLALVVVAMAIRLSRWDVTSDVAAPEVGADQSFPMQGQSDAPSMSARAAWGAANAGDALDASVPPHVAKPMSAVETNTHVAV